MRKISDHESESGSDAGGWASGGGDGGWASGGGEGWASGGAGGSVSGGGEGSGTCDGRAQQSPGLASWNATVQSSTFG